MLEWSLRGKEESRSGQKRGGGPEGRRHGVQSDGLRSF